MKIKSTIILSSIAAFAMFASVFAFNGNTVENNKVQNSSPSVSTTMQLEKAPIAATSNIENVDAKNTASSEAKAVKLSTNSGKSTANCPKTNEVQSSNNQQTNTNSPIKAKLEEIIKSYTGSSSATPNCNKTSAAKPAASKPTASKPSTSKPSSNTATTGDYSAFQKKVVDLVNAERAKAGLKPLKMNTQLSKTATLKSQDMAKNNYFDHNSPTYGSPFDMMKKYGISYKTAGENIAMGQTTPEQVMKGWMNSPGHRANILKASFTQIGVGVAKNSAGRLYWTQQFIG